MFQAGFVMRAALVGLALFVTPAAAAPPSRTHPSSAVSWKASSARKVAAWLTTAHFERPRLPTRHVPTLDAATIPTGRSCLRALDRLGVRYRKLSPKPTMPTGVVINGKLGGIRYYANGGVPLACACRLAVTLARIGPELRRMGVVALRHSGAYVVRPARGIRRHRVSLHAFGLAIDIHEAVMADGTHLTVRRDFARRLAHPCSNSAPLLNRMACHLASLGAFQELLTPDSNRAHANHFHLAIPRLR